LLKQIQGIDTIGIVQLGDDTEYEVYLIAQFTEWLQAAKVVAAGEIEPPPFIASYCNRCDWREHCRGVAQRRNDISLICGMRKTVRASLQEEGITTLDTLAKVQPSQLLHINGVGHKTAQMIVHQARAFVANEAIFLSRPILPEAAVELYFDVESVGFRQEDLRYYLFGWCVRDKQNSTLVYEYELAEEPQQEEEIWQRFLERIEATSGPVFHYTNYEQQTIKNLCRRYGDDPRARHLQERLVDLYPLVKNHVALPLKSYSIKSVAPWLGYNWTGVTQTASDTMIEYLRWRRTGDRTHLNNIVVYNEHDCRAMITVKDWLTDGSIEATQASFFD
jgi:uncharacterized protein